MARLDVRKHALALAAHFPTLRCVEVHWLRPAMKNSFDRAQCDLTYFDLDHPIYQATMLLNKEWLYRASVREHSGAACILA